MHTYIFFEILLNFAHFLQHYSYFIRINFPIIATCGKDASSIARYIPRVKHDHKDAILDCKEISFEEHQELQRINNNDPYLKCECKQEQEMIESFASRLELEPRFLIKEKKTKRESVEYRLKKQSYALKEKWWNYWEEEKINDGVFAY